MTEQLKFSKTITVPFSTYEDCQQVLQYGSLGRYATLGNMMDCPQIALAFCHIERPAAVEAYIHSDTLLQWQMWCCYRRCLRQQEQSNKVVALVTRLIIIYIMF